MSPDGPPIRVRELTPEEGQAMLGDRLADGFVVVAQEVAHAAMVGERELNRRQRRRQARGKSIFDE